MKHYKTVPNATTQGTVQRVNSTLSVFHATYAFVQKGYFKPALVWQSVRYEFAAFAGLMVLVVAPWDMKWSTSVYATDASLTGYGVAKSEWVAEDVAATGRVSEMRRWKLGAEKARSHALVAAGFVMNEKAR